MVLLLMLMLLLRRMMRAVVELLGLIVERLTLVLRHIVVAPSDSTSCCARVIRSLLPEKVSCNSILAVIEMEKDATMDVFQILPVEGIDVWCIQSIVHPRILTSFPPQIIVPALANVSK